MPGEQHKLNGNRPEIQPGNTPETITRPPVIAYNLRREERPDRLKVRYKVKVRTGRKARELDARQAEVIRELLQWARHHQTAKEAGKPR